MQSTHPAHILSILLTTLLTLLATIVSGVPAPAPDPELQATEAAVPSPPGPAVYPPTPTLDDKDQGVCDRAGIYICRNPNFSPPCTHQTFCLGSSDSSCTRLDGKALSIGPDPGITCLFYRNGVCRNFGDGVLRLRYPGIAKVQGRFFSFLCFRG
ncbi:uncharacterized protein EI97DRAFT_454629 [Westerdykella ornata]|uniref:Uncharacterized protein n=1 Tax=Westerdykella ornata TaxID=318751 RepID=A0A6A6K067_WESOR|nr:uncharacterized protein EI97DRAFT_454629 [Westerdykella ornata]KAF2281436.1 hypothetical protein EI97DRAFT_454629 [Westerdykella ornata]